jgi:hypothetical protein
VTFWKGETVFDFAVCKKGERNYWVVPKEVVDLLTAQQITPLEFVILCQIERDVSDMGFSPLTDCWMRTDWTEVLGISRRSFLKEVRSLEDKDLISVEEGLFGPMRIKMNIMFTKWSFRHPGFTEKEFEELVNGKQN